MPSAATKYGHLYGVSYSEYYRDGGLKACILNKPNQVATSWGTLVPQYEDGGLRRKHGNSLRFYRNGILQRIALHEQTLIQTRAGVFPAELLTFYEGGRLKRLFPLNGRLSAYWSEDDEYDLARELYFKFPFGSFQKKIIAIHFYETGAIKSLTFWPRDYLVIQTPLGQVEARIGIGLYENGRLRSFEPNKPVKVDTPIGEFMAFNHDASGIHGDSNSTTFNEDGSIRSLATCSNTVIVINQKDEKTRFSPVMKASCLDDKSIAIRPLWIEFKNGWLAIGNGVKNEYEIERHTFIIDQIPEMTTSTCGSCSGCQACG